MANLSVSAGHSFLPSSPESSSPSQDRKSKCLVQGRIGSRAGEKAGLGALCLWGALQHGHLSPLPLRDSWVYGLISTPECLLDSGLSWGCLVNSPALEGRGTLSPQSTGEHLGFVLHFER